MTSQLFMNSSWKGTPILKGKPPPLSSFPTIKPLGVCELRTTYKELFEPEKINQVFCVIIVHTLPLQRFLSLFIIVNHSFLDSFLAFYGPYLLFAKSRIKVEDRFVSFVCEIYAKIAFRSANDNHTLACKRSYELNKFASNFMAKHKSLISNFNPKAKAITSAIESACIIKMVVGDLYQRSGGYNVGVLDERHPDRQHCSHSTPLRLSACAPTRSPTKTPTPIADVVALAYCSNKNRKL